MMSNNRKTRQQDTHSTNILYEGKNTQPAQSSVVQRERNSVDDENTFLLVVPV